MVLHFLPVVALILYLLALTFLSRRTADDSRLPRVSRFFLSTAVVCHLLSLSSIYSLRPLPFLATSLSLASLLLAVAHLLLAEKRLKGFMQISLFLIIALYLFSSLMLHSTASELQRTKSLYLLWSHVTVTLFGVLSFLAAGLLSLGHLYEARALKKGRRRGERVVEVLGKLPPLRELSRLSLTALKGGLLLTVVGIFLGIIYTEDAGTVFRPTDLKLLLPSLLVVYYGVVVVMRGRISEAIFIRLSAGGMFFAVTSLLVAAIR